MADSDDVTAAREELDALHARYPETIGPNLVGQVAATHLLDEAGRCTGWYAGYQAAMRDVQRKRTAETGG